MCVRLVDPSVSRRARREFPELNERKPPAVFGRFGQNGRVETAPPDGLDTGGPEPRRSLLHRLRGTTLFMVTFVRDHLELTFEEFGDNGHVTDNPRLDCFVWPSIRFGPDESILGLPGYRDALCDCIGASVTAVRDDEGSGICLESPDRSLVIRPSRAEMTGPDIVTLWFPDTKEWDFWYGGTGPFAYMN
jgi:hypothetical protein